MRLMGRFSARTLLLFLSLSVGVVGCKGKTSKQETLVEEDDGHRECETNDDCDNNWVCLAGECTDASSKAIYTDPKHAVTPEKMFDHLQEAAENSAHRADEALGM